MASNKVYVRGNYVDVHDNEVVNLSIDKAKVNVEESRYDEVVETVTESAEITDKIVTDSSADIIRQLLPIFFGKETEAREFLNQIRGLKPVQITRMVNEWVNGQRISSLSSHRDLWMVLNKEGLYRLSESNWNQQVK